MARTARTLIAAPALAVALLGSGVALAPAASAGTTWNNVSSAAVTATQNGVTWKNVRPVDRPDTGIAYRAPIAKRGGGLAALLCKAPIIKEAPGCKRNR